MLVHTGVCIDQHRCVPVYVLVEARFHAVEMEVGCPVNYVYELQTVRSR